MEVAEDSPEVKKWSIWREQGETDDTKPFHSIAKPAQQNSEGSSSVASSSSVQPKPVPGKRPGPRKPKTSLSALPSSQKAKKLTTLDKSAMDWSAHINTQQDPRVKDELEANRRGGGYLEKVEFLKRVDERKEGNMEASKPSKRRKL